MNEKDAYLFSRLTEAERGYAIAFADSLAIGEREPVTADYRIDPKVADDIRAVLLREWRERLDASPALSGRQKITRRKVERRKPSG